MSLEWYIKDYIRARFKGLLDVFYSADYLKELIEKEIVILPGDKFIRDFIWTFDDVINKYAIRYGLKRKKLQEFKELIKKYDHNDIVDRIFAFINDDNINFGNKILDEYFEKIEEMNDKNKDILIKEFY